MLSVSLSALSLSLSLRLLLRARFLRNECRSVLCLALLTFLLMSYFLSVSKRDDHSSQHPRDRLSFGYPC